MPKLETASEAKAVAPASSAPETTNVSWPLATPTELSPVHGQNSWEPHSHRNTYLRRRGASRADVLASGRSFCITNKASCAVARLESAQAGAVPPAASWRRHGSLAKAADKLPTSEKWSACIVLLVAKIIPVVLCIVLTLPLLGEKDCPRETVCPRKDRVAFALLAFSRITAYAMYPCIVLAFLSKCHNLRTWLLSTQVCLVFPVQCLHDIHIAAGHCIHVYTWCHCVGHVIRWIHEGRTGLLYMHVTGVTGLMAWLSCVLLVVPMALPLVRILLRWELRKGLHWVSAIVFGLSVAMHAPVTNIGMVLGCTLSVYLGDWFYSNFISTYKVPSSDFYRLEKSVQLTFKDPPGFSSMQGGYVNVCVPFISSFEWHPFSVYPHKAAQGYSCVNISVAGDWTKRLFDAVSISTMRPCFIQGPFASPFSTAMDFDNLLLVASGIGITPALAVLHSFGDSREISLIWSCRDASLIEFYINTAEFNHRGWTFIFYTGHRELIIDEDLPPSVFILRGRPQLENMVCNVIYAVESGYGLPEELVLKSDEERHRMRSAAMKLTALHMTGGDPLARFRLVLARALCDNSSQEIIEIVQSRIGDDEHFRQDDLFQLIDELAPDMRISNEDLSIIWRQFDARGDGVADKSHLTAFCLKAVEDLFFDHDPEANTGKESRALQDAVGVDPMHDQFDMHMHQQATLKRKNWHQRWEMLYCGGSKPMIHALKCASRQLGIRLREESFDW